MLQVWNSSTTSQENSIAQAYRPARLPTQLHTSRPIKRACSTHSLTGPLSHSVTQSLTGVERSRRRLRFARQGAAAAAAVRIASVDLHGVHDESLWTLDRLHSVARKSVVTLPSFVAVVLIESLHARNDITIDGGGFGVVADRRELQLRGRTQATVIDPLREFDPGAVNPRRVCWCRRPIAKRARTRTRIVCSSTHVGTYALLTQPASPARAHAPTHARARFPLSK